MGGRWGVPPCLERAGKLRLRRGFWENERGEREGGSSPLRIVGRMGAVLEAGRGAGLGAGRVGEGRGGGLAGIRWATGIAGTRPTA
jgi:hypothetical protein